ncbi:hypothetical protein VTJ83DRAFT_3798 [Remersonia thermophila]|uniref:alpha-1,2-Mannosidase n=1 Tax=Remersonia thermophila TaxID=72144 RepID=A0ABR4DH77_9PEZI
MAILGRRRTVLLFFSCIFLFFLYSSRRLQDDAAWLRFRGAGATGDAALFRPTRWSRIKPLYPVTDMRKPPSGRPLSLPKVQTDFAPESESARAVRLKRRDAVRDAMRHCWSSYRKYAWMSDELKPVSGGKHNPFGGWGATLVDSLDTLWIMGLKEEFEEAVAAAATINFDKVPNQEINVFETNIRYLGGFLAAYDLSGDKRMLAKAREVGELLYAAFDTPNRMPVSRWDTRNAIWGIGQVASHHVVVAEIGTLSLEFIRLSMLTGDPKWYDAVDRITEVFKEQQQSTRLPGMWPSIVNSREKNFSDHPDYTLGALADSLYEYFPKAHALVGGQLPVYRELYETSMDTAIRHNLFRPMLPDEKDVLISGHIYVGKNNGRLNEPQLRPEAQHLVCFAGGMLALGGKLIQNDTHVKIGEKLMDGCVWTYQAMPTGIMPESFHMLPCESADHCPWDEDKWRQAVLKKANLNPNMDAKDADAEIARRRIPKGFTVVSDPRYVLRPEAIESVFILYRITGRSDLPDTAWNMFEAIQEHTKTDLANSAIVDVSITEGKAVPNDSMESFWLGETLKYFYLMFSEPDFISLDEYVFNTEAHPFKRLLP